MSLKSFSNPNSDEARQALLDRRCERKHPKRHGTKKRQHAIAMAKKQNAALRAAANLDKRRKRLAACRLYWAGLGDHPV